MFSKKVTPTHPKGDSMVLKSVFRGLAALTVILLLIIAISSSNSYASVNIYGYFSVNYEDTGEEPGGGNPPGEFAFPHFNLMMQSQLSDQFRVYMNFAGDGAEYLEVRNYWGEYVYKDYLKFRAGKIYRPFDLFNEKLDAVPSYLGIEPPELFDKDHLMLPRTGEFLVHGNVFLSGNALRYSLMTGNKEVIDSDKPISWDLNYNMGDRFVFGTSGYYSGKASLIGDPGDLPKGGILPWMESDSYSVYGAYAQARWNKLTVQAAFWTGSHDAVRDPSRTLDVINNAGINQSQLERFLLDDNLPATLANIDPNGDYTVNTYYLRFGYNIPGGTFPWMKWEMIPYFFWDYYSNPETIAEKDFGGDNEAGVASDGKFDKITLGVSIKPTDDIAIKLDGSSHIYNWYNSSGEEESTSYQEVRLDVSFFFK